MNNVIKSRIKRLALVLIVPVLILAIVYIADRMIRCTTKGLSRNDAVKIADKKLKTQFRNNPSVDEFVLVAEQFDNRSWMFSYQLKDCYVDIIIDRCGVADVGGLSEGCIARTQKSPVK